MSHAAATTSGAHGLHADHHGADLSARNITLDPAKGKTLSLLLIVVGLAGLGVTIAGGFAVGIKHAVGAYHVGAMSMLAISLGALFMVLAFHLIGAGWSVTIRRQFENVASLVWLPAIMAAGTFVIEVATGGHLYSWLQKGAQSDPLLAAKSDYLNPVFFAIRAVLFLGLWVFLSRKMFAYSTEQDRTGDKWLTNRARFTASWGMPLLALSIAFAAFDWLKSIDYRFFSTMWGVYYFAGSAFVSTAVVVMLLTFIKKQGRLEGLVNEEHFHDLGKLMFAFTVFWAYIGFSQYFLIWYANIPEETSFILARKHAGWGAWTQLLMLGHFVAPFYILLWRPIRRSMVALSLLGIWFLFMQIADMVWIIRPMVYSEQIGEYLRQLDQGVPVTADPIRLQHIWLDIAGIVGAAGLFFGLLIRKVYSGQLIPTRDPRLPEALHHRNYV
ncbi:MAG: hypothetical protein KF678_12315 [Phycisphaeraceae bacterium]|jgi:hypothetical protein|nr:hypothetical protein [Phycisphaeraceae bacterium]